jgi:SAM-dependent methyltransferase
MAESGQTFDLVWCRDVLEQVADLSAAAADLARLTRPNGSLVVFTTVATELLTTEDAALLGHHLGNVPENLFRGRRRVSLGWMPDCSWSGTSMPKNAASRYQLHCSGSHVCAVITRGSLPFTVRRSSRT